MNATIAWYLLREFAIVGLAAAAFSAALIVALMPLLARYALARPTARSSHTEPTPQGGGIAVIAATLIVTVPATMFLPALAHADLLQLWPLFGAVAMLAVVGAVDDILTIEVLPRLVLQFLAVIAVVAILPADVHLVPALPLWIERAGAMVAGVWFVNLVNFMDGIDWMTAAEVVPVTAGVAVLALLGALPAACLLVALALFGAMLGFAPFNRPVAKLFLGDVGSLPIGLLLFWLLLALAGRGYVCAAVLLPLYYLADATATLLLRLANGERIMQAHHSHFYQRAIERGFSVPAVILRVFTVNVVLVALALASAAMRSLFVDLAALALGGGLVALLLAVLARGRR